MFNSDNLNGQTARRGLSIHFLRYQFQHQPDQVTFPRALLTLLQQVPLEVVPSPGRQALAVFLRAKHWLYWRALGLARSSRW